VFSTTFSTAYQQIDKAAKQLLSSLIVIPSIFCSHNMSRNARFFAWCLFAWHFPLCRKAVELQVIIVKYMLPIYDCLLNSFQPNTTTSGKATNKWIILDSLH